MTAESASSYAWGRPADGRDRPRHPGGEAAPAAAAVAAHDPDVLADDPHDLLGLGLGRDADEGDDLAAESHDGRTGVAHGDGVRPGAGEALLEEAHLVGVAGRAVVVLVGLGDDDDHGPVDVPAERARVGDGVDGGAGASGQGVAEELGAVLALDGRDGLVLGDGEGGDRRGPLEQAHVVDREVPVAAEGDEDAVVEVAGDDAHGGAVGGRAVGARAHRLGLGEQAARAVEALERQRVVELALRTGAGDDAAVGRRHHHGAVEEADDLLAEVVERAAGEDDLHERAVGVLEPAQDRGLVLEDGAEHLGREGRDVVERDVDERQPGRTRRRHEGGEALARRARTRRARRRRRASRAARCRRGAAASPSCSARAAASARTSRWVSRAGGVRRAGRTGAASCCRR